MTRSISPISTSCLKALQHEPELRNACGVRHRSPLAAVWVRPSLLDERVKSGVGAGTRGRHEIGESEGPGVLGEFRVEKKAGTCHAQILQTTVAHVPHGAICSVFVWVALLSPRPEGLPQPSQSLAVLALVALCDLDKARRGLPRSLVNLTGSNLGLPFEAERQVAPGSEVCCSLHTYWSAEGGRSRSHLLVTTLH